jgi:DNA polymerase III subunit gamma/tau
MSYRALYRVWRPQHFRDLVGQEYITTTLANSLTGGHISHAYLFSGPRGTGKTSAAKIFAKAVNCIHGPAAEPCNQCDSCKAITEGVLLDVVEIDAASNRGVDEIRDLRDKVKYAPTEVRYKVYIIDEVHMLTTEAFNALLKTLEEPPAHVIFILATTEPHKLPATIISRCQRFPFRRIPHHQVVERLMYVVEQEGITAGPAALEQIARSAEGGLRDALSLLDQAISFAEDQLTEEVVLSIIGGVSQASLLTLLEALRRGDGSLALTQLDKFFTYGIEVDQVVQDLLTITRDFLLIKTTGKHRPGIAETVEKQVDFFTTTQLAYWVEQLVVIQQQLKWVNQPQVLLELFVIRQCSFHEPIQEADKTPVNPTEKVKEVPDKKERLVTTREDQSPQNVSVQQEWPTILNLIKQKRMTLYAWLADGEIMESSDNTVTVVFIGNFHRDTVLKSENKQLIEQEMKNVLGKAFELKAFTRGEWERHRGEEEISISADTNTNTNTNTKSDTTDDIVKKAIAFFGEELVSVEHN